MLALSIQTLEKVSILVLLETALLFVPTPIHWVYLLYLGFSLQNWKLSRGLHSSKLQMLWSQGSEFGLPQTISGYNWMGEKRRVKSVSKSSLTENPSCMEAKCSYTRHKMSKASFVINLVDLHRITSDVHQCKGTVQQLAHPFYTVERDSCFSGTLSSYPLLALWETLIEIHAHRSSELWVRRIKTLNHLMKLLSPQAWKGKKGKSIKYVLWETLWKQVLLMFPLLCRMCNSICSFLVHWFIKRVIANAIDISQLSCSAAIYHLRLQSRKLSRFGSWLGLGWDLQQNLSDAFSHLGDLRAQVPLIISED